MGITVGLFFTGNMWGLLLTLYKGKSIEYASHGSVRRTFLETGAGRTAFSTTGSYRSYRNGIREDQGGTWNPRQIENDWSIRRLRLKIHRGANQSAQRRFHYSPRRNSTPQ